MEIINTVGLVVVQDNGLLLAYSNNKQAWMLPGGKIDAGETALEAIHREIKEELSIDLEDTRLTYFCERNLPAFGQNPPKIMRQTCYLHQLTEEFSATNEIGAVQFFSAEAYAQEPAQVRGVTHMFELLKEKSMIE